MNKERISNLLKTLGPGTLFASTAIGVSHLVQSTRAGAELILMRLSDAIGEMDGIEGERTHRSWWVARDAVRTSRRDGRNLRLILHNGLEVPVSRTSVAKLKQLGWI